MSRFFSFYDTVENRWSTSYTSEQMNKWYWEKRMPLTLQISESSPGVPYRTCVLEDLVREYGPVNPFRVAKTLPVLHGTPISGNTLRGTDLTNKLNDLRFAMGRLDTKQVSKVLLTCGYNFMMSSCPFCEKTFGVPTQMVAHCLTIRHAETLGELVRYGFTQEALEEMFAMISQVESDIIKTEAEALRLSASRTRHIPILYPPVIVPQSPQRNILEAYQVQEELPRLRALLDKTSRSRLLEIAELKMLNKCLFCGSSLDNVFNSISHIFSQKHVNELVHRGHRISKDDIEWWTRLLRRCM